MKKQSGVYFVGGYIARRDLLGLLSYLYDFVDTDAEHTRFYTFVASEKRWKHREIGHQAVSLVYTIRNGDPSWRLLSKRGVVVIIDRNGVAEERIEDADTGPGGLGYVTQIAEIAGELYVCGYRRQVYRYVNGRWNHMDQGILGDVNLIGYGFESIDGTGPDNIYAVGWKGEMYRFDGSQWGMIASPTSVNLNCVRCVAPDLVYACGESGVLLRGHNDTWDEIVTPGFSENLWGLDVFQGTLYVAHLGGLMKLEKDQLVPVVTGLDPELDGYRLHATSGVLWSFGHDHLGYFDGNHWQAVVCPDNGRP